MPAVTTADAAPFLKRTYAGEGRKRRIEMPKSDYYGGHGTKVAKAMKEEYGEDKGGRVFYATANKRKQRPEDAAQKAAIRKKLKKY